MALWQVTMPAFLPSFPLIYLYDYGKLNILFTIIKCSVMTHISLFEMNRYRKS